MYYHLWELLEALVVCFCYWINWAAGPGGLKRNSGIFFGARCALILEFILATFNKV